MRTAGQPCVDGPASIIPQMPHMLSFPFAAAPRDGARSAVAGFDSGGEGAGGREREREKGRERSVLVWAHKEGEESKAGQLWTDPNYFFPRPRHYGYWQEARRRLDGSNAAEHAPDECAHSARAAYATDGQYNR